jgi:diphthamide synthase subunit DPH2
MDDRFPHIPLPVTIGPYSRDKWKHVKNPGDILIDDRADNIEEWIAAGGIGILHDTNDGERTIRILKELTS